MARGQPAHGQPRAVPQGARLGPALARQPDVEGLLAAGGLIPLAEFGLAVWTSPDRIRGQEEGHPMAQSGDSKNDDTPTKKPSPKDQGKDYNKSDWGKNSGMEKVDRGSGEEGSKK